MFSAGPAGAEPASQPGSSQAGYLDAGWYHSCARLSSGAVRCWGQGTNGKLGYDANVGNIGDNETPATVGPVNLGPGRTAVQVGAGEGRSCALMDNSQVRCWGSGGFGGLGYASTEDVGNGPPSPNVAARGPVDFGVGTSVKQITVGNEANCAILNDNTVKCWGQAGDGALGYGNENNIGDNETPAAVGAVDLASSGADTAVAVSAGGAHTCAILTDGSVRCWGLNNSGQLGRGDAIAAYGDDSGETPAAAGPVDLGGATAVAIAAGGSPAEGSHTCVILSTGGVKCWGEGDGGRLGYGNTTDIGDTETPASVGVVDLGPGRTATAITAGTAHTCVILDTGGVRCWGFGFRGRTGHGAEDTIGDGPGEMPGAAVDLGPGRTAVAISAGAFHTCARLDDGSVICWGRADDGLGQLGYGNTTNIGDNEPASAGGPLALGDSGPVGPPPPPPPPPPIVPDTTITEQPKSKLKTKRKKVRITYEFSSSVPGSTFECALDGTAPKPCTSPQSYKVKKGRHTFAVTATAGGQEDPSAATDSFKVKRKKPRPT